MRTVASSCEIRQGGSEDSACDGSARGLATVRIRRLEISAGELDAGSVLAGWWGAVLHHTALEH